MQFLTLLGILPEILGLISRILELLQNKKVEDAQSYVRGLNSAIDMVTIATTQADHEAAAKELANALAGKI